jgi:uncharacterized membrane protein
MSLSKNALNALIAGAFAFSLVNAAGHTASAQEKEKCYGVVKAGQNDCADPAKTHSCAGQTKVDGSGGDFVALPKGVCEKLVGGSTTPYQGKNPKANAS